MIVSLFSIAAWLLGASLAGILFAIPSLVPALRRRAKQFPTLRRNVRFGLSALSFVAMFLSVTWLYAQIDLIFHNFSVWTSPEHHYVCTPPDGGDCPMYGFNLENEDTVLSELWLRNLLPPFMDACYTGDALVCESVDRIQERMGQAWGRYGFMWLTALMPALMTFWLVGRATIPERKRKIA